MVTRLEIEQVRADISKISDTLDGRSLRYRY